MEQFHAGKVNKSSINAASKPITHCDGLADAIATSITASSVTHHQLSPDKLLSAQSAVTSHKVTVQNRSLSIFQQILLTTNGTVTDLLALYTGEKIKVNKLAQQIFLSGSRQEFICPLETPLLERNVLLCGATKNYVYAESVLVFGSLSRSIQYKLLETDQPIGLMWKQEKLETYRDILAHETEINAKVASYFEIHSQTPIISRTYSIYHQHAILGTITEKFPITYFTEGM